MKPRRVNGRQVAAFRPGMKRTQVRRVAKRFLGLHEAIDEVMVKAGEKFDLSCTRGCAHCCRQVVTMSVFEAMTILEGLLWDPMRRRWYFEVVYPKIERQAKECMTSKVTVASWFDRRIDCVFLRDNECQVYDRRPVACRVHAAISPPEVCAPPRDQLVAKVDIKNWFEATEFEVMKAHRETGITLQLVPLPVALAWATTAIEKGAATLGRELRSHPIFGDDMSAMMWWAQRFTSTEDWERFKERHTKEADDVGRGETVSDERGAGGTGGEGPVSG